MLKILRTVDANDARRRAHGLAAMSRMFSDASLPPEVAFDFVTHTFVIDVLALLHILDDEGMYNVAHATAYAEAQKCVQQGTTLREEQVLFAALRALVDARYLPQDKVTACEGITHAVAADNPLSNGTTDLHGRARVLSAGYIAAFLAAMHADDEASLDEVKALCAKALQATYAKMTTARQVHADV